MKPYYDDAMIEAREAQVIGAMRLGLQAAASDRVAVALVKRLLEYAPETPPDDKDSTRLLIDVVTEHGSFELTQT